LRKSGNAALRAFANLLVTSALKLPEVPVRYGRVEHFEGSAMQNHGPRALLKSVARHPWASARDFLVLTAAMVFCVLVAQAYDIFGFIHSLAHPQHEISPAESVVLGAMAVACVWIFIQRRLEDARHDLGALDLESEMSVLRRLASQDPLTNLPNRRVLLEALDVATNNPPRAGHAHAVFLLDLNGFKHVNDRYGHAVGDEVLKAVVGRFRRVARANDIFARLGGDEFAVLSRNVDESGARDIGERFIRSLANDIRIGSTVHSIGVAIGAALFPEDGDSVEKVLRHADVAMYRAKSEPGSSLVFFKSVAEDDSAARKATA
jgi:diguanylate cyclase (GGDEF)-like protein